jgi:hypothetical protein
MNRHGSLSRRLSLLSDRRLGDLVASATAHRSGIGGRSGSLELDGTRVFVKRVPLTDLESRHARTTANLFRLPLFYQYGVGSSGFGAWRELAAHTMTTEWVLGGAYGGFPLMYHWRVLPDSPPEGFADEFGGVDGAVRYWAGSPAVRARLEALGRASSSVVLFLEHLPWTLGAWLSEHPGHHPWVEEALARGTAFMRERGFAHFDAHFANVLTDGRALYFADLGLALSRRFDLSADEAAFLAEHRSYDACVTMSQLLRGVGPSGFLRSWFAGRRPEGVPPELAALVERHGRAALVLEEFHHRLVHESKRTPFPAAELERLL